MAWFVRIMGDVRGPLTNEQFKAMADSKRIDAATEVAKSPQGPWFPAADVPNLFSAPPPLPATAVPRPRPAPTARPVLSDRPKMMSRASAASCVLGILSYVSYAFLPLGILLGMLAAIPAIACGVAGLTQISRSRTRLTGPILSGSYLAIAGVVVGFLPIVGGTLRLSAPVQRVAPTQMARIESQNNLMTAAQGMLMAENMVGSLPLAIVDTNGRSLLSWRVAILPFIGEKALFDEFRLNEPWDSDHNRAIIPRMPDIYRCLGMPTDAPAGHTSCLAAAGPGMTFDKPKILQATMFGARVTGVPSNAISDGPENTILLIELGQDAAVPWTKPEELSSQITEASDQFGRIAVHSGYNVVVFADAHTACLRADISPEKLKALLTRSGKEPTTSDGP